LTIDEIRAIFHAPFPSATWEAVREIYGTLEHWNDYSSFPRK
jgi:hypothetical protein